MKKFLSFCITSTTLPREYRFGLARLDALRWLRNQTNIMYFTKSAITKFSGQSTKEDAEEQFKHFLSNIGFELDHHNIPYCDLTKQKTTASTALTNFLQLPYLYLDCTAACWLSNLVALHHIAGPIAFDLFIKHFAGNMIHATSKHAVLPYQPDIKDPTENKFKTGDFIYIQGCEHYSVYHRFSPCCGFNAFVSSVSDADINVVAFFNTELTATVEELSLFMEEENQAPLKNNEFEYLYEGFLYSPNDKVGDSDLTFQQAYEALMTSNNPMNLLEMQRRYELRELQNDPFEASSILPPIQYATEKSRGIIAHHAITQVITLENLLHWEEVQNARPPRNPALEKRKHAKEPIQGNKRKKEYPQ